MGKSYGRRQVSSNFLYSLIENLKSEVGSKKSDAGTPLIILVKFKYFKF
jgi:hypothetical protein